MDIQIVKAEVQGEYILVYRLIDGKQNINRMPKQILSVRAAEYDLPVDDPRVLDIVLLEGYYEPDDPEEIHPLFSSNTIEDALEAIQKRIEKVRDDNGAPKKMPMRSLFHAADTSESTQGLTEAKEVLLEHADPEIGLWVQINRDEARKQVHKNKQTLTEAMRESALAALAEQAQSEDRSRSIPKR